MTYRGIESLHIPADFWDRADVLDALAIRSFTTLFLLLTAKPIKISQTRIAVACDLTQSRVSAIVNRKGQPEVQAVIERIAAGLQMPDHARVLLGLAPLPTHQTPAERPQHQPAAAKEAASAPIAASSANERGEPPTLLAYLMRQRNQTYEEAAEQLNIGPRQLGRLARRERTSTGRNLHPSTRRALHTTYGYPAEELLRPWRETEHAARRTEGSETHPLPTVEEPTTRPAATNFTARDVQARSDATRDPLERPTFVVDGTVGESTDTEWAGMLRRTILKAPAALAGMHLVAASMPDSTHDPLDPALVHGFLGISGHYRRAYHAVPASRLLPAALAHLDLVLSFRPTTRPGPERIPLVTAAGEMATLAGVLLGLDAARHQESLAYFDMAWAAARSVNNVELQAVILASRSFALAYGRNDHQAGLESADLARRVAAAGASPQTRGWVAAVASERSASLGDLAGCQQRLDESRSALTSADFGDVPWRGIGGFDADKLRAYEGGDLMRLHRYRDAEPILDDALSRLDPSMSRHRATALLDRAEARLGLGDVDAACADASRALALVTHVQHTGHLERIETLTARGVATGAHAALALHRDVQLTRVDNGLPIRETPA